MPWKESRDVNERMKFIVAIADGDESFSELCRNFGISRKTGYKWLERYEKIGPSGLENRLPVAKNHPHRTPNEVADLLVQTRKDHPFWGPKKLHAFLMSANPNLVLPALSTIGEILKNRGLIRPRRRRLRVPLHTNPLGSSERPNAIWCADYKGHFALGDRSRCHPLTISDEYSRYLFACEGMPEPKTACARTHFERVFREFGMPERIRTDNGAPFATKAPGGLSELSVWWLKLGIHPERIEPGKPEQNGRHERMHRTLKEEVTQPPCGTMAEQQRAFDRFRREYNDLRPHEALGQKPPAKVYARSARAYPERPSSPEYDESYQVRRACSRGRFLWRGQSYSLSTLVASEPIGLLAVDDGLWEVYYGPVHLGTLDERKNETLFIRRE